MRNFEVVAVVKKTFEGQVPPTAIAELVSAARYLAAERFKKYHLKEGINIVEGQGMAVELFYKILPADSQEHATAKVRTEIGEKPDIISVELIPEEGLSEAHG